MNTVEKKIQLILAWTIVNPVKTIVLCLALVGVILFSLYEKTAGFTEFPYNNNPRLFFNAESHDYKLLEQMEDQFNKDEGVVFLFVPNEGDIFTRESLKAIQDITELAWEIPSVYRVDSLANFQHTELHGEDELETDYLYRDVDSLTDADIEKIKRIALKEKSLLKQSISLDGRVAGVLATTILSETQEEAPDIMAAARAIQKKIHEAYPHAKIMMTGDVAFSEAAEIATQRETREVTPYAMAAVTLCLIVLLRSISGMLVTLGVITLSILVAGALMILVGLELSPVPATGIPIIMTLAVADCVHILVTYQQQCSLGKTKKEAMLESMRVNFQPVWLTSITTAIGFLLLNFADSKPFNDLGTLVAIGVMAAFFFALFLLPQAMMLLPMPRLKRKTTNSYSMEVLARFVIRYSRPLIAINSVIVIALVACIPRNQINDVFNEYYDDTFEVRRVLDFYLANMGGVQRVQFNIPSTGEGGALEPEYLKNVDKFVTWLEAQPEISHVWTFTDVVKRLNRNMHGGDDAYYRIPDSRELIAQYVLLYELGLPQGLGLENMMTIDKSRTKLQAVMAKVSSAGLLEMKRRSDAWIAENWPDYMQTRGIGIDVMFSQIAFDNVKSMLGGTVLAFLMVSFLLIFALRSLKYGLLSLLPNLLPALVAFGIWGLMVGQVGLVIAIVGCMTLGIVVDDTVHFLSKYVRAKRENRLSTEEGVIYAFRTVGTALIGTTVVLVANFGIMGTSHFYLNSSMGQLAAITLVAALLIDFFLFVPLLIELDKFLARKKVQVQSQVVTEETA